MPRGAPTLKEREEHNLTHLPYRSWCPACVAGRGRGPLHRKRKEEAEEERPLTVCLDFWYPGKGFRPWGGEEQEGEEEEEEEDSAEGNAAAAGGSSSSTDPGDADGERPLHKLPALVLWEESTKTLAATPLPSKSLKDFTYYNWPLAAYLRMWMTSPTTTMVGKMFFVPPFVFTAVVYTLL